MKILLHPFLFILSWSFWFFGHTSSIIMEAFDNETWNNIWFVPYQRCMLISSALQDAAGSKGGLWPWGGSL
jgi:hypothetical protein